MDQQRLTSSRFVMILGVTAVLFFLGLLPLEIIPEIPVDIDSKPFFIPLLLSALLPAGRPGFAVALGVAMGEGLRDLMEGYELDDPFGFVGYILGFSVASRVMALRPLSRPLLVMGALLCAAIQSAFEASTFLLFGKESVSVAIQTGIGNLISHGVVWGALPLVLLAPALHGRFERYLGFAPNGQRAPQQPLPAEAPDWEPDTGALAWARGLSFRYPGSSEPALHTVSLAIQRGEVLGLIGPSGAGKTTLCHALAGLAPRSTGGELVGDVCVAGVDPARSDAKSRSNAVAYVGQSPRAQLTQTRAIGEVAAGLGEADDDRLERAGALLRQVGVPQECHRTRSWELSEGQQRLVVLAAALASEPQLLLLDEVAGGLDATARAMLAELLGERRHGRATLLVDNDVDRQLEWADRVAVLCEGRLLRVGLAAEVLGDRELMDRIGFAPPVALGGQRDTSEGGTAGRGAGPALQLSNLAFSYEDAPVLDSLSLEARYGEVLGIAAANGAGKTTLARVIAGLQLPRDGKILVAGRDLTCVDAYQRLDAVAVAMRDPGAFLSEATVAQEIAFPLKLAGRDGGAARARVEELAARFRLAELLDRDPLTLRNGEAKRVQVAAVLARGAGLLVLDEPAALLDPAERRLLLHIVRDLARDGMAVLLLDHATDVLAQVADRVAILKDGSLSVPLPVADALAPERNRALAAADLTPAP